MFPSSARDQHLPPGFTEKPTRTSLYLNSESNYPSYVQNKQLLKAYTAQPLPCVMNSKSCSTQLTFLHTSSSVGILCDLVNQLTVQQEEVITNEIKPLALVCILPGNC